MSDYERRLKAAEDRIDSSGAFERWLETGDWTETDALINRERARLGLDRPSVLVRIRRWFR